MFDKSYKKIGINAALVCATGHHSTHLDVSVSTCLSKPFLAFSIHLFIPIIISSALVLVLLKKKKNRLPYIHTHYTLMDMS